MEIEKPLVLGFLFSIIMGLVSKDLSIILFIVMVVLVILLKPDFGKLFSDKENS